MSYVIGFIILLEENYDGSCIIIVIKHLGPLQALHWNSVAIVISLALQERFRPLVSVSVACTYNMSIASKCGGNVKMCCETPKCYVSTGYYIGSMELDLSVLYAF